MNILIFSWRGPGHPNAGGAEISTHEHAKGWVQAGHSVTLFTSYYKGAKRQEEIDGVEIIRSGSQFLGVHWEAFKWYLFGSHEKFDIVIDQFHGIPFFTPLYVRSKKLAFIHEVAKEVWFLNEFSFPLNLVAPFLGKPLEPLIFKLYQGVNFMTVSESTKADLIGWGVHNTDVTVIYNGIDQPDIKEVSKEKTKTIIFLGALAKDKGIEKALEIFSLLQKNCKDNIHFWVVGKGHPKYEAFLKEKSGVLGLRSIKFWGYVSNKQKFNLLARAHILINTSFREGWGLVVLEAASVGTPTVAFNVPGLRDSILNGKTGILCDNAAQMVFEIESLLNDEGKLHKVSKNAISWSKNFSWDKATRASLNLIKKLVDYKK